MHNGVDTDKCRPANQGESARARARLLPPAMQGRLVVGSNAGTADYKNWIDMVTAVSLLPAAQREQIVVLIAGKLPGEEKLRQVAELVHVGTGGVHGAAGQTSRPCWPRWTWASCCRPGWRRSRLPAAR